MTETKVTYCGHKLTAEQRVCPHCQQRNPLFKQENENINNDDAKINSMNRLLWNPYAEGMRRNKAQANGT